MPAAVIVIAPLLVVTFRVAFWPTLRLSASVTVSVWPAPVMLATIVLILVSTLEELLARRVRTLPITWLPLAGAMVIAPLAAVRETLAEPALITSNAVAPAMLP